MVRAVGLEPTRHKHTPLKRACLPVPACSHLICNKSVRHQTQLVYYTSIFLVCQYLFSKKIIIFLAFYKTIFPDIKFRIDSLHSSPRHCASSCGSRAYLPLPEINSAPSTTKSFILTLPLSISTII